MYVPPIYKNENLAEVREFVQQNSFGILVSSGEQLLATHIPLELMTNADGKEVLAGHISRGNPQGKNLLHNTEVLAIFTGAHSYISPSWYDHENVPTWNYIAVHIYGTVKILDGAALIASIKHLVDKFEQDSKNPVSVERMSEGFLQREMRGLLGFEIEITNIQAAYKLSQNRDAKNHKNIIDQLESKGDQNSLAIAAAMQKHQKI
jgi:transcriptional regulator